MIFPNTWKKHPNVPNHQLMTKVDIAIYSTIINGQLYGSVSKPYPPSVHIKIAGVKWMFIPLNSWYS
jgi:hypothetical protein